MFDIYRIATDHAIDWICGTFHRSRLELHERYKESLRRHPGLTGSRGFVDGVLCTDQRYFSKNISNGHWTLRRSPLDNNAPIDGTAVRSIVFNGRRYVPTAIGSPALTVRQRRLDLVGKCPFICLTPLAPWRVCGRARVSKVKPIRQQPVVCARVTVIEDAERVGVVQRARSLFAARRFPYQTRRVDHSSVQYGTGHVTCATKLNMIGTVVVERRERRVRSVCPDPFVRRKRIRIKNVWETSSFTRSVRTDETENPIGPFSKRPTIVRNRLLSNIYKNKYK